MGNNTDPQARPNRIPFLLVSLAPVTLQHLIIPNARAPGSTVSDSIVACPQCGTQLSLPPGLTATRFRCTQCNTVFDVAAPVPMAVPAPVPAAVLAPVPVYDIPDPDPDPEAPAPLSRKRGRRRDEDEDEDESRSQRRSAARRSKGNGALIVAAVCAGALVLVGLVVGAYYALRAAPNEEAKNAPAPPQGHPKPSTPAPKPAAHKRANDPQSEGLDGVRADVPARRSVRDRLRVLRGQVGLRRDERTLHRIRSAGTPRAGEGRGYRR